jgi:hypothetical protein
MAIASVDAVVFIEAVLEKLFGGVNLVQDRVGVFLLITSKNAYQANLRQLSQELIQHGSFVNENLTAKFIILKFYFIFNLRIRRDSQHH